MPAAPVPVNFNPASANFEAFGNGVAGDEAAILTQFAADNALLYRPKSPSPNYPGILFADYTVFPYAYDHLSTTSGRFIDFGNFCTKGNVIDITQAVLGVVNYDSPFDWGFMAVQLDQHLPNILLVSKQRGPTNKTLPVTPASNQVLSLEGNFDTYFTLYCPQQFEQEALSVFTPDLMALLIDDAAPFDVEIVDKWMFFYSRRPFNSLDPGLYRRLFSILATIGRKIVGQTALYQNQQFVEADAAPPAPAPTGGSFQWDPSIVPDKSLPPGEQLQQKSTLPGFVLGSVGLVGVFVLMVLLAAHVL